MKVRRPQRGFYALIYVQIATVVLASTWLLVLLFSPYPNPTLRRDQNITVPSLKRGARAPPITVVLWPYAVLGPLPGQIYHLAEDGIAQSSLMTLSSNINDFDPDVVWVAGESAGGNPHGEMWCQNLSNAVINAKQRRVC